MGGGPRLLAKVNHDCNSEHPSEEGNMARTTSPSTQHQDQ